MAKSSALVIKVPELSYAARFLVAMLFTFLTTIKNLTNSLSILMNLTLRIFYQLYNRLEDYSSFPTTASYPE